MAIVISADEIKKKLVNYSPDQAEKFHRESAKLADVEFTKILKNKDISEVIIMSGGSASGKTEFLMTQLLDRKNCLIFDTTLSSELGAKIKITKILQSQKKPVIYAVTPDNLKRAFIAFLHRDRKFSDIHFYGTHSGSRKTLLWIFENFPNIKINIVESSFTEDNKMLFRKIEFRSRKLLMGYLRELQLSETDIIEQVL